MCRCVLRVIAAAPKQATLSCLVRVYLSERVCLHVFDSALPVCVETATPSWTAVEGGKKSRTAGRTLGDAARNPQSSEMLRLGLAATDYHYIPSSASLTF